MTRTRLLSALLFTAAIGASSSIARADQLEAAVAGDLTLTRVLNQLPNPTAARFLPDGRMVIIGQGGDILVYTGTLPLIDAGTIPITGPNDGLGEQGLLGLAVDPQFATSNRLYFYYSEDNSSSDDRHRVAWATIDPATSIVDVAGRTVILSNIHGPANHNGGGIEFGPDGNLYIGVGDTGCNCGCSPGTNTNNYFGTCLTNVNGKILRIDRDGNIPASNPLVGLSQVTACGTTVNCGGDGQAQEADPTVTDAPRTEIYNWGFRNPWRFSFDQLTGYLWIGDVGEVTYEEITVSTGPGLHHGWPYREGVNGQDPATCSMITPNAIGACVDPVFNYQHNGAASVTGGVFSNHCSWPAAYSGLYWFGDYNVGRIWTLTPNGTRDAITGNRTRMVSGISGVVHFFDGLDGAIYYVAIDDGEIWRIEPTTPVSCNPTDAGVVDDQGVVEPADTGVVEPDTGVPPPPDSGEVTDNGELTDNGGAPPPPDAGEQPAADATTGADGGNTGGRDATTNNGDAGNAGGGESSSCGCDATSSAGAGSAIAMFFVIAWVGERVRRGRRP